MHSELEQAEAVLDGLAGLNCCVLCEDRPSYFSCTEANPDGVRINFCTRCVRQFAADHAAFFTVDRASRVLRYAAHAGWADDTVMARYWITRLNVVTVQTQMVNDPTFRQKYLR